MTETYKHQQLTFRGQHLSAFIIKTNVHCYVEKKTISTTPFWSFFNREEKSAGVNKPGRHSAVTNF